MMKIDSTKGSSLFNYILLFHGGLPSCLFITATCRNGVNIFFNKSCLALPMLFSPASKLMPQSPLRP